MGFCFIKKIRQFLGKYLFIRIIYNIFENYYTFLKEKINPFGLYEGKDTCSMSTEQSIEYFIKNGQVFVELLEANNIKLVENKVLEVGCGDSLGLSLQFLLHGVKCVVAIDKNIQAVTGKRQKEIFKVFREQLDSDKKLVLDKVLQFNDGNLVINNAYINYVPQKRVEDFTWEGKFDIIISNVVLQSVRNIDKAFKNLDLLLNNNGIMVHRLDFRDLGALPISKDRHPLTFLTINEFVWRLIASHTGKPNRKLINYYREKASELGYDFSYYVTHILGEAEAPKKYYKSFTKGIDYGDSNIAMAADIRRRLLKQYQSLANEELIICGAIIVMKKSKKSSDV